ncbi:TauD/TfdA family dioxygenase [Vibrio sagamiensis]|uniref:TauD/TfdA-like domain-containing protein n=1 Tax=Vibrio sagamiensis NBRC 104589 TaxID=1219064 RepID=A0A511QK19_9VIBR|nr:TauD/TfdA family dioxygenase [Vibrio sagamiensis]GEM77670.1 hypothetical protein VSA01S_37820 [Vibrio sagamiensis NBRC 104589]
MYYCDLNLNEINDKYQKVFNPFFMSKKMDLIVDFKEGKIPYIIFKNTGLHLKCDEENIENNSLDMDLRLCFISSVFKCLEINPITYEGENNGYLFRKVTPVKSFEKTKSSFGGKEELGFHVDNNHLSLTPEASEEGKSKAPDYLSLLCIRNNEKVPTIISDINQAIKSLTENELNILLDKRYTIDYPDSFKVSGKVEAPVLVKSEEGFYSRFDYAFTTPNDKDAKKAFDKLNQILTENSQDINLDSGDLIIFRNQKVVHGRKKFNPKYDGFDRFLIRLFGVDELRDIVTVSDDQPYHSVSI